MKRITIAIVGLAAGATAGCVDMGLEGNIPLEEARDRQTSALVAAVMRPVEQVGPPIVVDGRLWLPSGTPLTVAASDLRSVGSAEGQTVYAWSWDAAPYDALYVRTPAGTGSRGAAAEQWIEFQPVLGRTGGPGQPDAGAAAPATGGAGEHAGH